MNRRRRWLAALLVACSLGTASCSQVVNPATGERQYTSLTPEEEARMGRSEHPKVTAEFGGVYQDRNLQGYIERIGRRLVEVSELKGQDFTFTVLDSDVVNAFALPGGYVYVTRGLLALADNEAEVAGVLGHEIGHVTARHTAQRYDKAVQGQIGATAAQLGGALLGAWLGGETGARLGGQLGGSLGSAGATAYVQGYSREQEFQADELGIRYLERAGYDPRGMGSFLAALQANDELEAKRAGGKRQEVPTWMRSHPRTPDRVRRAAEEVAGKDASRGRVARDELLAAIDGLVWGDSVEQGFVQGGSFVHPALRFRFEAPRGFRLENTPAAVQGADAQGRFMQFDTARARSGDPADYIEREWAKGRLQGIETTRVSGLPAAYGFARVAANGRQAEAMLGAIAGEDGRMYRFAYIAPDIGRGDLRDFEDSFRSFERISAAEAERHRPLHIRIRTVQPGDTVESLASRMDVPQLPRETFAVLNDIGNGRRLEPGQKVKLVVRD